MEQMIRDFKGIWIPKEIWLNPELSPLEKIILAEIDSLDTEEGCWASNTYLAEFCMCSERKITDTVSKLVKNGLLRVVSFDGRTRKLASCLVKNVMPHSKKCEAAQHFLRPINIENNIDDYTPPSLSTKEIPPEGVKNKRPKAKFQKPTIDEIKAYADEIDFNLDPQAFLDFYESKGWMIGKNPMKDWKAAVRTWKRMAKERGQDTSAKHRRTDDAGSWDDLPAEQREALRKAAEFQAEEARYIHNLRR